MDKECQVNVVSKFVDFHPNCEISLCHRKALWNCELCLVHICYEHTSNGHANEHICHYCQLAQWIYENRKK